MKRLFIAWQDPVVRLWVPVGILTKVAGKYSFKYTAAAKQHERFTPFGGMKSLDIEYESEELFPLFANRLLSKSRPEYKEYMGWLNLSDDDDPLEILAISQGQRGTDSLRVYSDFKEANGQIKCNFFVSGIKYLSKESLGRIQALEEKEKLFLMLDVQNQYKNAITIRTAEDKALVGYCPNYLSPDVTRILMLDHSSVKVTVEKINSTAPLPYMLLCSLIAIKPKDYVAFSHSDYI